jgi:transposase InsO family protein
VNSHKNARLTPRGREILVKRILVEGQTPKAVATAFGVCPATAKKWVERYLAEGLPGLLDRPSRPRRQPTRLAAERCREIAELRRQRWTGAQIAAATGISRATVFRTLARLGLNRLKSLEPAEPVRRYERERPGELIHIDIKKLGRIEREGHRINGDRTTRVRGAGWEFAHVCIDDASRLAYVEMLPDEGQDSAVAFLERAVAYFNRLGITVERVMTDNGSCYRAKRFAKACRRLGLRHIFTKPYTPKTNGKAERFIQTALREWAYARSYQHSDQRTAELPWWLHRYNWHRPHGSLQGRPPISKLGLDENNVLRLHT